MTIRNIFFHQKQLVVVLLTLFSLALTNRLVADDTNLLVNPGFEAVIVPWQYSSSGSVQLSTAHQIEGASSFKASHGGNGGTTGVSQILNFMTPGTEYVFSANVKVEDLQGQVNLLARFYNGPIQLDADISKFYCTQGLDTWQKVRLKIRVPEGANRMRVFVRFVDTIGDAYADHAQLCRYDNLLLNSDCEDMTDWVGVSGDASWSSTSYFGDQSIRIVSTEIGGGEVGKGLAPEAATAAVRQYVPVSETPMYTLSARIKTVDVVSSTPDYGGAHLQVRCVDGSGALTRIIDAPYVLGTTGAMTTPDDIGTMNPELDDESCGFVESKISFLVPAGTVAIRVFLELRSASGAAWFDDIRLTGYQVPPDIGAYQTGIKVAEAAEPNTFIDVQTEMASSSLQQVLDSTSEGSVNSGLVAWLESGDYFADSLVLQRGTHLRMHRTARLQRTADGGSGYASAFIKTSSFEDSASTSDVVVEGGQFVSNTMEGIGVAWRGDRWVLRNYDIPTWNAPDHAGRAVTWYGDDAYIYDNTIQGPGGIEGPGQEGYGGIVMAGGERAHIMSNDIFAGDDAIGLFTGTRASALVYNKDIREVEIYNNMLNSTGGRAFACGIAKPRENNVLTADVQYIRVRNGRGVCGGKNQLITITNYPSLVDTGIGMGLGIDPDPGGGNEAIVSDIYLANLFVQGNLQMPDVTDVSGLDCLDTHKQHGLNLVTHTTGSLSNIEAVNVRIKNVIDAALRVRKFGSKDNSNILIRSCTFDGIFSQSTTCPETPPETKYLYYVEAKLGTNELNDVELHNNFLTNYPNGHPDGYALRLWVDK